MSKKSFTIKWPFGKDKRLGIAEGGGRYDLPLSQSAGTNFLIVLVALMTFLAIMALSATMFLGDLTQHWSSGLENRLTVEIPALTKDGDIRDTKEIEQLVKNASNALNDHPDIKSHEVLGQEQIHELVEPWLGDDAVLDDLPLPGLISVHMQERSKESLQKLESALQKIAPDIRIDTHESWLGDILRLAGTLKFSALITTLIILLTTITAIAGAIRSRMAEHKADIELLHLMGASDLYITRQLQRHAIILTLKGSFAGLAFSATVLFLLSLIGSGANSLLPGLSLNGLQIFILILLPALVGGIAAYTARFTVLRVLGQMP